MKTYTEYQGRVGAFIWGVLFGAAIVVMMIPRPDPCEKPQPVVSARFAYTPGGCDVDWPQYATVCHFIDSLGNHVLHTRW